MEQQIQDLNSAVAVLCCAIIALAWLLYAQLRKFMVKVQNATTAVETLTKETRNGAERIAKPLEAFQRMAEQRR